MSKCHQCRAAALRRMTLVVSGLVLMSVCLAALAADVPVNLIANGDFSVATGEKPQQWETSGDIKAVTQTLRVVRDAAGKACAELVCTRCEAGAPSAHAMLAQVGVLRLVKGQTYEFSCRLRSEGLAGGSVSVAISDTKAWANCGLEAQSPVGGEWRTFRRVFRASRDVGPANRLQIWFAEPGTLWVGDVRLVESRPEEVEFTEVVPPTHATNLLPNGSFEVGPAGWMSMGAGVGWGDLHRLHGSIESTGGQHGRNFLRIPLGDGQTPVLSFDYFEPVVRRELRPLAASRGWIRVEKGEAYTLSCFMRCAKDATPALLGARAKDPAGASQDHKLAVKLTTEWKRYAVTFRPQQRYVFVYAGPDLAEEQRVDVDVDAVQLEKGEQATAFAPAGAVEFGIEPAAAGGVSFDNEDRPLILRAANHGDAAAKVTVRLSATDYLDAPAALPEQTLEIPARSNVQRPVKLPADWRGYYRVVASADGAIQSFPADVRLAIVPRRTGTDSVLGVNHAFVSPELIRLAGRGGVTWYRDWSLKWQHMEPAKGQYHWELGDAQIDRVLREGASVLPLLPPFPSADWSSEAPAGLSTRGYPGVRIRQAWGPKDPAELAGFISQAVLRYKDRIHIWDFLNEPIYTDYSLPADSTNRYGGRKYLPADYVSLLEVAATAMRKADPSCKVVGGIGSGPTYLTREVIDAGILKQIDIFNLHMYPGLRAPESFAAEMSKLLALMDAHGGRKPIWITEFAYYGADDLSRRPFNPADNSWAEARLLDSERQCADYTTRFFVIALARGVQKVFLHDGGNGKANDTDVDCPLLVHGTPRKLLPALAVLTQLLGPAPSCVGERNLSGPDCCVAFETPERSVLVFWQASGDGSKPKLPAGPGLTWMDAMGRKLDGPPAKLTGSPVYLVASPGRAKELQGYRI